LSCLLLAAGCDLPGKPDPKNRPVPSDQVLSFEGLYGQNCAGCHGKDGEWGPAPPLSDPLFRAGVPEEELEHVITSGRPGTPMPAFAKENGGLLTAAQIGVLVKEIKGVPYKVVEKREGSTTRAVVVRDAQGVTPKWGAPGPPAEGVPPYRLADAKGAGDKERGTAVFARACAGCHGKHGRGGEGTVGAINDPDFLALVSDQALRRYAITGRPDLGMPDYAGKTGRLPGFEPLTSQDIADLVALLAYWRQGGPAAGK
jgi:mono/diheme cytochrome c family protein